MDYGIIDCDFHPTVADIPAVMKEYLTREQWIGAEQTLLYSSDYPHWDSEEPQMIFKNIDDGLRRRIFRENAIDFFGSRLRPPQTV